MYYIGIDGGGTKTLFSLYDEKGNRLAQHIEGTSHYAQVGYDGLSEVISKGVAVLCEGIKEEIVVGVGLAGYGREVEVRRNIENAIKKALPHYRFVLKNDAQIALKGALGGQDGILVIAGTGSIAMSMFDGVEDRCGGWGFAIGDEGSAYWIAKQLILEFSKQSDGRKEKTYLYELLKEHANINEDADLITYVLKTLGNKREAIASLASLCAIGAQKRDEACLEIYRQVAKELSSMINVLAGKYKKEKTFVSYTGGVWKGLPYMEETFSKCLDEGISIIEPMYTPDYGAFLYAKELG